MPCNGRYEIISASLQKGKSMFTGLIQKTGRLRRVSRGRGLVLEFAFEPWSTPLEPGESVAVDGVCLTVARCDATHFTADVLGETERRSTLGSLVPGACVNLERAMRWYSKKVGGVKVNKKLGFGVY